jgi:hypothetical protein
MPVDREAGAVVPALHCPDIAAEVRGDLFPRVETIARGPLLQRCSARRVISVHDGGQV